MPQDRLRKYNDENLELSKNLRQEMNAQRRAAAKPMTATVTRKRDLNTGSARGSEERTAPATAAPSRGTKRGREFEGIDKVSELFRIFVTRDFYVSCGAEVLPLATRFLDCVYHNPATPRGWTYRDAFGSLLLDLCRTKNIITRIVC